MLGRDLVLKALNFEKTDRTPWVPFTGVHCAKLLGMSAQAYLKDPSSIIKGVKLAADRYLADGVCAVFDLQIEAEALGCELRWSKNNPPAVCSHVLDTKGIGELGAFTKDRGRIADALFVTEQLKKDIGDTTAIFGLLCGPFTLALHLAGSNFLTDMIEYPDKAGAVLDYCAQAAADLAGWYVDAGADVVALVDPMTSQISPRHFRKYVTDTVRPAIEHIKAKGAFATLFCCGDATKNIELMMQCAPNGIAFDEQVSVSYARELGEKYKVAIEGNLHLTTTLLFGSPIECVADAHRCIKEGGDTGFILSPGCDMPFDTPEYNLEAIGRYVVKGEEAADGFMSLEEALAQCCDPAGSYAHVTPLPGELFVEVVTLDSEGCSPCQYMLEAISRVRSLYEGKITVRETLIKSLAGIKRIGDLGVKNLPSMLINNELVFDNLLPTDDELIAELDRHLCQKI